MIDEVSATTTASEDPARAMTAAAELRYRQFGPRVTYSRKV